MVGEVERRVGAEQTRELGVLRPTRYERGPVAAQAAYLVLSRRRSDHDSTGRRVAVELDPLGQWTAGARVRVRARNAPAFQRELETVWRQGEHHLFGLAERVAEQHRRHTAVERAPAPPRDGFDGRVGVSKPEMWPAIGALQYEDVGPWDMGGRVAAWLAQLDVAGVEEARAIVLESQLRGAEHVTRRVQGQAGRPAAHRLAESKHPPAARAARLRDQRQRLRRQERFFVSAGVICVRVGYKCE